MQMQVTFRMSDTVSFVFDAGNQKDAMEKLSDVNEVFGNNKCGKCDSTSVYPVVREVDGNKFYEIRCGECKSRLNFGAHKTGDTIFPKRKDSENNWLNNGGWVKWNSETKREE